MSCIWIKQAFDVKRSKFKLENVSLNAPVSDLKAKLSESSGIDEKLHDVIYRGLLLKDDKTLESYGLKDNATLYIIYKEPKVEGLDFDVNVEDIIPVLQAAAGSPVYKDKMSTLLKNPETLETILVTTPALAYDPVALSILRDPEILQNLVQSGDISKIAEEHPALVQAASQIAADITKDIPGTSRLNRNAEDDDLMDIEPEILAQAELMAAHEEAIQNRQNPGRRQAITSSFLASALQAARANLVSTSTQTNTVNLPSTSTGTSTLRVPQQEQQQPRPQQPQRQRISSEFFNQAMATALSANASRNNWQSEVQQLREMGIEDEALSLRALQATNGNVQAACDLIFEGGLD